MPSASTLTGSASRNNSGTISPNCGRSHAGISVRHPAIWSTEAGYSSAWYGDGVAGANLLTQAKYDLRQVLTGLGLGLPMQIVFGLADVGTNPLDTEDNFGIVSESFQTKPLTTAMQTLFKMSRRLHLRGHPRVAAVGHPHLQVPRNEPDVIGAVVGNGGRRGADDLLPGAAAKGGRFSGQTGDSHADQWRRIFRGGFRWADLRAGSRAAARSSAEVRLGCSGGL